MADARILLQPNARVRTYLPVLVARQAREQLMSAAQAEGKIAKSVPELLFVCDEDWDVADPAGQPIDVVRDIRDDIQARVTTLLRQILT